jgi:hypothetical protein
MPPQITITGTVLTRSNNSPVPNLTVQAWDGDDFDDPDDLLGSDTTNEQGVFSFPVREGWKDVEPENQTNPDVYFRIYNGNNQIHHTIKGKWTGRRGADQTFTVTIKVNADDAQPVQPPFDPQVANLLQGINTNIERIADREDRTPEVLQRVENVANEVNSVGHSMRTYITHAPTANENGASRQRNQAVAENLVTEALRDILGKRVDVRDAKALQSSFDRVFSFEQVDGNRIVRWQAPNYSVETDLGADLTGAQASFYQYARQSADELKKRINLLKPLSLVPDEDRNDAARSSFLAELDDLIGALGQKNDLRPIRIRNALNRLDNYFLVIEASFGFNQAENIHTVDDERAETEYLIAGQYLTGIRRAWENFQGSNTLGSTLLRLERLLAVVTEGVEEVYAAMDAIQFDAAERHTHLVDVEGEEITVGEILEWVLSFANHKAPLILKDGGRIALFGVRDEADQLRQLIEIMGQEAEEESPLLHPRVQNCLSELESHLENVVAALPQAPNNAAVAQARV